MSRSAELTAIIEQVRAANDIVQVIGRYVKLAPVGSSYKGLCPFHNDHKPSLSVNPVGQYFHCFGCGAAGDVFKFVEMKEGRKFTEVLADLAGRVGIALPSGDTVKFERLRAIGEILGATVMFYERSRDLCERALAYLCGRGFSSESIAKFRLGYAGGGLTKHLKESGFSEDLCLESGVLRRRKDTGELQDYFGGRIIFPSFSRGRAVHLSGRNVEAGEPRYLHLPGPIVHLFNEDALSGAGEIVICEGPTDTIAGSQAGLPCVGVFGVQGFKSDYVAKFKHCGKVYVCFDADDAGRQGAARVVKLLGGRARVIGLPEGEDLADYLKTHTAADFQVLEDEAVDGTPVGPSAQREEDDAKSEREILWREIRAEIRPFRDQHQSAYVILPDGEYLPAQGREFSSWLSRQAQLKLKKSPCKQMIIDVMNFVEALALAPEAETRRLDLRVTVSGDLVYDLGNGRCAVICPTGWQVERCQPLFRRFSHQMDQPTPTNEGSLEPLWESLPLSPEPGQRRRQQALILGWVGQAFRPAIGHFILIVEGPQGAAKTTVSKVLKQLVDPSRCRIYRWTNDLGELVQQLAHHHVLAVDNLTRISAEVSDLLSSAVTGSSDAKRRLYSNDEDFVREFWPCLVLNGISIAGLRPDVLDRSLCLRLGRIEKPVSEEPILGRFTSGRGAILGAVLDLISKGMKLGLSNDFQPPHRMAAAARYGWLVCEAAGLGDEWLDLLRETGKVNAERLYESDLLFAAVTRFISDRFEWAGCASELKTQLEILENISSTNPPRGWPKGTWFGRRLRDLEVPLGQSGIELTYDHSNVGTKYELRLTPDWVRKNVK